MNEAMQEFRMWFDGFVAGSDGRANLTESQWSVLRNRIQLMFLPEMQDDDWPKDAMEDVVDGVRRLVPRDPPDFPSTTSGGSS